MQTPSTDITPESARAGYRSFAIIPAAGRSARMGRHKLLMPWGASTLIERVLAAWTASRVARIVVVVRPSDRRLREICGRAGVEVAIPEQPPPEMKQSVQVGLRHVQQRHQPEAGDVWLLAPADMPRITGPLIDRLLADHDSAAPSILAPTWNEKRGHPTLFPWPTAREVLRLGEEESVRTVVERHVVRTFAWSDDGVLADVDSPADYRRLHP